MKNITVSQMNDFFKKDSSIQFIDVREPQEFAEVHAEGAVNMPLSTFFEHAQNLDISQPIYVICRSGGRSLQAAEALEAAGASEVTNVLGGTLEWVEAGLPTKARD